MPIFSFHHQKRREAPAFMPGMDRRWARRAQCPRAQQDLRSTRALNGRGHCIGGSPGIHAGEDVPLDVKTVRYDTLKVAKRIEAELGDEQPCFRHLAKINYPFMSLAGWYNSIRRG